jgi:hypothetical protein
VAFGGLKKNIKNLENERKGLMNGEMGRKKNAKRRLNTVRQRKG